jgi:hypothetical protein
VEYYGLDSNNIPEKPYDLFFGRWVGIKNRLRKDRCATVSADSVSVVLVIRDSLWPPKNWKIKELNGL